MSRSIWSVAVALVAAATVAHAQGPGDSASLEREARAIDAMLIAPCCFSQQVSVHQSPAADEVRREVRARLAAGEPRQQILDAYVARYGKRILAEPPATGFDLTLYVLPFALLLVTFALLATALRYLSGIPAPPDAAAPGVAVTADENARLDDDLRDLD